MMTRVIGGVLLVLASLGIAACGRDSAEPRVVSVSAMDQGTRASHTARFAGRTTRNKDGTTTSVGTGVLNFDENAFHLRSTNSGGQVVADVILIGKKGYGRGAANEGLTPNWCPTQLRFVFDPGAVLQSLTKSHATLNRIGTDTIRGVQATHYHVVWPHDDGPTTDLWVDAQDRLRRMIKTDGLNTATAELYDFGEPISPIRVPVTSGCHHRISDGADGPAAADGATP